MFEAKWRMCIPYCGGLAYQLILFTSFTKGRFSELVRLVGAVHCRWFGWATTRERYCVCVRRNNLLITDKT